MNKKIPRIPKKLLEKEENIISNKEALKDVIPIDFDKMIVKDASSEYIREKNKKKEETKNLEKYVENEQILIDLEYDFIDSMINTRKSKNLTQQDVANNVNIFREAIARIETNKVSPQLNTIIKILYSMGYKLDIVPIEKNK